MSPVVRPRQPLAYVIAAVGLVACRSTPGAPPTSAADAAPAPAEPGLRAMRVAGAVLNYVDTAGPVAGAGATPIVLVHGARSGLATLQRQVATYSAERRTIAYSRRWHAPNPAPAREEAYTPALHASDLAAFTTRLGLRRFDLVGLSYGGLAALEFARRHPERVRALVLSEPAAFGLLPTIAGGDTLLAAARAQQAIVRRLFERGDSAGALSYYVTLMGGRTPDSTQLASAPEATRARAVSSLADFRRQMTTDFDAYMPRLTCADLRPLRMPVLLIRGAGTLPAFTRTVDALAQCLPQARVVTRATGPGHGAVVGQDPAGFDATVLEFLRSVAP